MFLTICSLESMKERLAQIAASGSKEGGMVNRTEQHGRRATILVKVRRRRQKTCQVENRSLPGTFLRDFYVDFCNQNTDKEQANRFRDHVDDLHLKDGVSVLHRKRFCVTKESVAQKRPKRDKSGPKETNGTDLVSVPKDKIATRKSPV